MNGRSVHILLSLALVGQCAAPSLAAEQPELNFKIYAPPQAGSAEGKDADSGKTKAQGSDESKTEIPKADPSAQGENKSSDSLWSQDQTTRPGNEGQKPPAGDAASSGQSQTQKTTATSGQATDAAQPSEKAGEETPGQPKPAEDAVVKPVGKVLQGYIRVVPSGTKIPIIMDTAVDSDTSQEGDEFAARTSEDLNIDGNTVVPAGSVIKGRIAQLNAPKSLERSGSVALKFDTVTTPDNRQIPIVANLVARGGVVHARRGLKDVAIAGASLTIPTALGIGIGALAGSSKSSGSSKSHINKGEAAVIGAAVGAAIGIVILCIKKGNKVDVRPGDELKIELAEDLRMPM